MNELFANIIVDVSVQSLNKSFVYRIPDDLIDVLKAGDKVSFPFGKGNTLREGYVIEILTLEQLQNKSFYKRETYFKNKNFIDELKYIVGLADKKIGISETLLKIAIFLCKEYYAPMSKCLATVLPVKKIIRKNIRQKDVVKNYEIDEEEQKIKNDIILNIEQKKVVDSICNSMKVDNDRLNEHLIYGVTGSGKTEVYIKIIEEVLKKGKSVIVLIPEIALTHQTVIRLKHKFKTDISIIHSRMSEGERYIQYKKCEENKAHILVGPRSAVFAPFENLGLIVIDEVDDSSYKSETIPRYNTIDVARYRCKLQNATLISLSATPHISMYYDALKKRKRDDESIIILHELTSRATSSLPEVTIVDMKKELRSGNKSIFSKLLIEKIKDRLEKKEQIMLFMNRRGYDTIFTCKGCGETYKCPHCDVALVTHNDGKLKCHYCGYEILEPFLCPKCHSKDIEKYGMGTEKLEEECIDLFPNARILRMDRDTTKEKNAHDKIIEKFKNGEADILIGTQMIIKGHDFKNVTLVGVMRADLLLNASDYKASENSFSMLTQCVGRSGRFSSGESIIQSYDTDSFVMQVVKDQDYKSFYESEIKYREKLNYPPFSVLLKIITKSDDSFYLDDMMKKLKICLDTKNDVKAIVLGPSKTNPEKVKDNYYRMIIVKCDTLINAKKFRRLANGYLNVIDDKKCINVLYDIE